MEERPHPVAVARKQLGSPRPRRVRLRWIVLGAAVALLLAAAWVAWRSVSRGTLVTPHTEARITHGQNLLWCATAQMAWDEAARVAGLPSLEVRGADDSDGVRAMSLHPFPREALDPKTFVVAGGGHPDPVGDRFSDALRATFGAVPEGVEAPNPASGRAAAYAYLLKEIRFRVPFVACDEPVSFRTGPTSFFGCTEVQAFGYVGANHDGAPTDPQGHRLDEDLPLTQVRLHWQDDPESPSEFIIELLPDSRDRILLARIEPESTLERTWQEVARRTGRGGAPLPGFERFAIPKIDIGKLVANFDGLRGTIPQKGTRPAWTLERFAQWTKFRLDETGARLESFSGITMTQVLGDAPEYPSYVFDRPFLVALIEKGATRPYFLLWIGNADLLVKAP